MAGSSTPFLAMILVLATFAPMTRSSGSLSVQCGKAQVSPPSVLPSTRFQGDDSSTPKANSWPWHVSLHNNGTHYCSGSLLDPKHVITAGHCVQGEKPEAFKVLAGVHDLQAPASSYQTLKVKQIIQHPEYHQSRTSLSNDVAILVLETPAQFNKNVSSVCLPENGAAPGTTCFATGFANERGADGSRRPVLKQFLTRVVSIDSCNETDHYNGNIDETMMCTEIPDHPMCWEDSGGPLVYRRPGNTWELQGVIRSGFITCGPAPVHGVYARVTHFKKWLRVILV